MAEGRREVLGFDVGPSEDGAFWEAFLRGLVGRGLAGFELVIGAAHEALKGDIAAVLHGASWQRCGVQFARNALALVPKWVGVQAIVAATIRAVFAQPTAKSARAQLQEVVRNYRERFLRVAQLIRAAESDVLAYLAFPR
jgi:transposase-like protein